MDYKQIQDLIKAVNRSKLTEVSIKNGDFEISIKKEIPENSIISMPTAIAPQAIPQYIPQAAPSAAQPTDAPAQPAAAASDTPEADNLIVIKSPMIGTFYRRPAPDKDPFVSIGDTIKDGDVLCVVEAMKLFNEIESEVSGKIVKILVDDSSPVEYDQPLFLVEPE